MSKTQKIELLPLTDDYVFKRVFTKDGQEDMLKDLLSAILNVEIKKIEIKNPELTKQNRETKREILDIRATINDDSLIDVEMQVRDYRNIDKRSIAYLTKLYSEQLQAGDDYNTESYNKKSRSENQIGAMAVAILWERGENRDGKKTK